MSTAADNPIVANQDCPRDSAYWRSKSIFGHDYFASDALFMWHTLPNGERFPESIRINFRPKFDDKLGWCKYPAGHKYVTVHGPDWKGVVCDYLKLVACDPWTLDYNEHQVRLDCVRGNDERIQHALDEWEAKRPYREDLAVRTAAAERQKVIDDEIERAENLKYFKEMEEKHRIRTQKRSQKRSRSSTDHSGSESETESIDESSTSSEGDSDHSNSKKRVKLKLSRREPEQPCVRKCKSDHDYTKCKKEHLKAFEHFLEEYCELDSAATVSAGALRAVCQKLSHSDPGWLSERHLGQCCAARFCKLILPGNKKQYRGLQLKQM